MKYPYFIFTFLQNCSISYGFRDICDFMFSAEIHDGRQKLKKNSKILISAKKHLLLPCVSKIWSKSLYLLRFSTYLRFFVFRKNSRWPPKIVNLKIWYSAEYSSTTLRVENSLEIALSLMVFEIFAIFLFSAKNSRWPPKIVIKGQSPAAYWPQGSK